VSSLGTWVRYKKGNEELLVRTMASPENWNKVSPTKWKNQNVTTSVEIFASPATGSSGYRAKTSTGAFGGGNIIARGSNKEEVRKQAVEWMRKHPYREEGVIKEGDLVKVGRGGREFEATALDVEQDSVRVRFEERTPFANKGEIQYYDPNEISQI